MLKLSRKLRDFAYDPEKSFRGWLKTIAHRAWRDFVDSQKRARTVAGDHSWELLQSVEAREDLILKLEEAFDHEMLEEANLQVRLRVAQHTWDASRSVAECDGAPRLTNAEEEVLSRSFLNGLYWDQGQQSGSLLRRKIGELLVSVMWG